MCALDRNVKELTGKHVGRTDAAADHGCTGTVDTGIRSLGTAQAELHDAVSAGGLYDTGCLGRDQTLVVYDVQKCSLNKLRLHDRCDDLNERFVREYDGALRDRPDITLKMEAPQVLQERCMEDAEAVQIRDVFIGKMQIFNIINDLIQPGCDRVAVAAGIFAVKGIKNDRFI